MPYLLPYQRRRRSNAFFCLATTALLCAVALTVLRPRLGLFLASLPFGAYLVPRSQWTRSRIALAFCTYGTCLLSGGLIQLSLRPHVVAVVPTPEAAAPEPHEKPPPPPRPAPVGSCSWMRARAPTATCEQHSHSRHSCSRQYVNVQEDGRLLSSPCVFNWSNPGFGRCEAAETRYECKKLGVSDTLLWNLLRAMLLIVFLTLVLPVLLPWLKAQMPSYGLMSNEAYERQCELTTEKELAKLRQHVQSRGMPATLSAHAQDRTRAMDALRWMQHVLSPEKRAALDGFEIGEDGRRVDLDDDDVSLSEGSESDRE